jgi:5-methylcytosine-specific restriction enzyme B
MELNSEKNIEDNYNLMKEEGRIKFITFHPSYSYEEFIEGITVDTTTNQGDLKYIKKEGTFKKMCSGALCNALKIQDDGQGWKSIFKKYQELEKSKSKQEISEMFDNADKFVLIIDEINRGDISKIFGELITLIEADKRISSSNELLVDLPCSNETFGVPPNVYIIGTMNTADRSIALLDVALRRRFGFIEMMPRLDENSDLFKEKNKKLNPKVMSKFNKLRNAIISINECISDIAEIGRHKQIGHSFLFNIKNNEDVGLVWNLDIIPLIEEYCYLDKDKLKVIFELPEVQPLKEITKHAHIIPYFK